MVYPVGIDIVAAAIHHNFHPMGAMTCVDQPVQFYLMDLRSFVLKLGLVHKIQKCLAAFGFYLNSIKPQQRATYIPSSWIILHILQILL